MLPCKIENCDPNNGATGATSAERKRGMTPAARLRKGETVIIYQTNVVDSDITASGLVNLS